MSGSRVLAGRSTLVIVTDHPWERVGRNSPESQAPLNLTTLHPPCPSGCQGQNISQEKRPLRRDDKAHALHQGRMKFARISPLSVTRVHEGSRRCTAPEYWHIRQGSLPRVSPRPRAQAAGHIRRCRGLANAAGMVGGQGHVTRLLGAGAADEQSERLPYLISTPTGRCLARAAKNTTMATVAP